MAYTAAGFTTPPHPQVQVATAGQLYAAVSRYAPRTADRQDQALATGVDSVVAAAHSGEDTRIPVYVDIQIATAQGPKAGETHHLVGLARYAGGIGPEVDPPGSGLCLAAGQSVALAPQPVTDVDGVMVKIIDRAPNAYGCRTEGVTAKVSTHFQQQVAAPIRVPGAIEAFGSAIDQLLVATRRIAQDLAIAAHGALEVIRVIGRRTGGRTAGGVDTEQRLHAQVPRSQQLQVCRAGTHHAEAGAAA